MKVARLFCPGLLTAFLPIARRQMAQPIRQNDRPTTTEAKFPTGQPVVEVPFDTSARNSAAKTANSPGRLRRNGRTFFIKGSYP
jgi:hypothetical protein